MAASVNTGPSGVVECVMARGTDSVSPDDIEFHFADLGDKTLGPSLLCLGASAVWRGRGARVDDWPRNCWTRSGHPPARKKAPAKIATTSAPTMAENRCGRRGSH